MKEILLTSSVLILALLALRRLFRRTVSRRMQYALWLLVLVRLLVRSQFGLVLAGLRQQESRIAFFGYKVQNYKGVVFSLAGFIAGLSGGLFAAVLGFWRNRQPRKAQRPSQYPSLTIGCS